MLLWDVANLQKHSAPFTSSVIYGAPLTALTSNASKSQKTIIQGTV